MTGVIKEVEGVSISDPEEGEKEEKKEKFLWTVGPIKVPTGPRRPDGKEGGDPDFLQITNFVVDQLFILSTSLMR